MNLKYSIRNLYAPVQSSIYETIKQENIPVEIELREKNWDGRHFAIKDTDRIGIDILTYKPQQL